MTPLKGGCEARARSALDLTTLLGVPLAITLLILSSAVPASAQNTSTYPAVERELAATRVRFGSAHRRIVELEARLRALPRPVASRALCEELERDAARLSREAAELSARYGPRHQRMQQSVARREILQLQRQRWSCPQPEAPRGS